MESYSKNSITLIWFIQGITYKKEEGIKIIQQHYRIYLKHIFHQYINGYDLWNKIGFHDV